MKYLSVILILSAAILTGCGVKEKIYTVDTEATMEYFKKDELESGIYYIKDGTDFMKVLSAQGNVPATGDISSYFDQYMWILSTEEVHLPTLYKGESIALKTKEGIKDGISLKRLRDAGYTFGISGLKKSQTGFAFTTQNILKGSNAETVFSSGSGMSISEVDGMELKPVSVSSAGMVVNLEKENDYELTIFSGSQSVKKTVNADAHAFIADSTLEISDHIITQNGYIAYQMPETAASGYYLVEGQGIFRYINEPRSESGNITNVNFNEGCNPISADIVNFNIGVGEDPLVRASETELETEGDMRVYDADDESSGQGGTLTFEQTLPDSYETLNFSVALKDTVKEAQVLSVWCEGPDGISRSMIRMNDIYTMQANMEKSMPGKYTVNIMGNEIHRSEVKVQALLGNIAVETESETETEAETFVVTGQNGNSYIVSGNQAIPQTTTMPQAEANIFTEYEVSGTMPAPEGGY